MDQISIANVPDESVTLWVHGVCTWLISVSAYLFLLRMHSQYINLHHKHLYRATQSLAGRAVMIEGLPSDLLDETKLTDCNVKYF
jgi:hypothetical protein